MSLAPASARHIRSARALGATLVRVLLIGGVIMGLSACGSDGDNLKAWLRKAKATKGVKLDPLPQPLEYQAVQYVQAEERTPFEPVALIAPEIKPVESEITPDFNREREPLESYSLSELVLVGMVDLEEGMVALVQSPQGEVSRIREGNFMGRNFGRVESMNAKGIELREIVKDDIGRWQKRATLFGFAESGGGTK